ncbi:MAG: hypothetical protein FRX49_12020 [Trebouxia sp. A1-2]|nr:MAG: hypothetical protein FRX49_12020 [Trebouxia sp. A1-2]
MHGLEQQQTEAEDSQALEGWAAEAQQAQERNTTPTPHIASMADIPKQRVIYSKDDLTDIAEKSSQEPVESTSEPISHVEHQIPEDQQYSEADWAAYWQYYVVLALLDAAAEYLNPETWLLLLDCTTNCPFFSFTMRNGSSALRKQVQGHPVTTILLYRIPSRCSRFIAVLCTIRQVTPVDIFVRVGSGSWGGQHKAQAAQRMLQSQLLDSIIKVGRALELHFGTSPCVHACSQTW